VTSFYHRLAGNSVERLVALSDGIFAVVMTLLVLDLHVPDGNLTQGQHPLWTHDAWASESALLHALGPVAPTLLTYVMSFLTLGIFWMGQQAQLSYLDRTDRRLTWIHLMFLLSVSLMPFSTALLSKFIGYRIAVAVYWLNLLLLGVLLLASLRYAGRAGLMKEGTEDIRAANVRRIAVYQILYFVGLLLSVVNTYVSIGFIVLLQLNSVLAPRIRPLNRF
jgi:uncharacterized membrane protein